MHGSARRSAVVIAALCLMSSPGSAHASACRRDLVEIVTETRTVAFRVEIADTPATQARGLMFRTDLPRDAGMLFLFPAAEERAFWMRNTPLPLDMLFAGPDGRICGIVANAAPFTDDRRWSGCPALAVLEINGGLADALGIAPGAALRHPAFGPDAAAPCG
jgi:uncharacterized membrane protein (UPF0127 family)